MNLEAIKEATLVFFKAYYTEHGKPPSVKLAWKEVEGLTKRNFYVIFKGGVAEACRFSGLPVPEGRIEATSKARNEREEAPRAPGKLEEEIQAKESEAKLEEERRREAARERSKRADAARLELEAMEDPRKILPYLRALKPDFMGPFFNLCEEAGLKPGRGMAEAVKKFKTWEEHSRSVEEPDFKRYVEEIIDAWVSEKRFELAVEHNKESWYTRKCSEYGLSYEYEDKKGYTAFTCPNGCVQNHGGVKTVYVCPVCKELGRAVKLSYDRSRGVLYCKTCNFEGEVRGEKLNPVGTKAGAFRPQIVALEEKVKGLNVKLSEVQKQVNAGERRVQVLEQKREREEISLAKLTAGRKQEDKKLDAVRGETAKERRLVSSLKRESKDIERKREVYNAMATFLTNPEMSDGDIDDVIRTLEAARDLRKEPGRIGGSAKMTVEVRDRLLRRIARGRYVLKDEAEKRLGRELAEQQREHERELKMKDSQIAAERRRRETAEREREALVPWRDKDMKKLERENSRLRDKVLTLEEALSDLRSEKNLQRIMASS